MPGTAARTPHGATRSQSAAVEEQPRAAGRSSLEDALNSEIIALLQFDGRMAFSEIADRLGVSEGTIRNRVSGMKDAGVMRIAAIVDPSAARYETSAMLAINVAPGQSPGVVAERLGRSAHVVYVLWVSGRFDLLVEVVTDNHDALLEFLNDEVHESDDIASAETMTGLKNFKNQFLLKSEWEVHRD